jgi:hypothetical protein
MLQGTVAKFLRSLRTREQDDYESSMAAVGNNSRRLDNLDRLMKGIQTVIAMDWSILRPARPRQGRAT